MTSRSDANLDPMATATDSDLDEELIEALRERGHRVTAPRLLVHRHVRRAPAHITADQVSAHLAAELPSLSPATVYATLDLLEALGFVRRVSTPRGTTVFDSREDAHHHLVCRRCGAIEDLDAPVETARARRAARRAGFRVEDAQLQLSGLCAACAAAPDDAA
jgi:Fe2+ or Zn2+ uptake regulation protein